MSRFQLLLFLASLWSVVPGSSHISGGATPSFSGGTAVPSFTATSHDWSFTAWVADHDNQAALALFSGCTEHLPNGTTRSGDSCVSDLLGIALKSLCVAPYGEHVALEGTSGIDQFQEFDYPVQRRDPYSNALEAMNRFLLMSRGPEILVEAVLPRKTGDVSEFSLNVHTHEDSLVLRTSKKHASIQFVQHQLLRRTGDLPVGGTTFEFANVTGLKVQTRNNNGTISPNMVLAAGEFASAFVDSASGLRESNTWVFIIRRDTISITGKIIVETIPIFWSNYESVPASLMLGHSPATSFGRSWRSVIPNQSTMPTTTPEGTEVTQPVSGTSSEATQPVSGTSSEMTQYTTETMISTVTSAESTMTMCTTTVIETVTATVTASVQASASVGCSASP